MRKPIRFEAAYDFKAMYLPPNETPVVDFFLRPGHLPIVAGGNLTLRLREGTDVGDTEYLVCMLNKFVEAVAFTLLPDELERARAENMRKIVHRPFRDDDPLAELIEAAEEAGVSGEMAGSMMTTEGARVFARVNGAERAKELLREIIEALDEVDPDAPDHRGSQCLH